MLDATQIARLRRRRSLAFTRWQEVPSPDRWRLLIGWNAAYRKAQEEEVSHA